MVALPELRGLRRLMLVTAGAEALYEKYAGFRKVRLEVGECFVFFCWGGLPWRARRRG